MEGRRALELKGCCYKHLCLLLKESVGMPFSSLADVNFLCCLHCRPKEESPTISSSSPVAPPSLLGVSSLCLFDAFFHEYSAALASKASKRARREYPAADSLSRSGKSVRNTEGIDDDDVEEKKDALTMAPTETSTIESIPLQLLFGDAILSRLPLCDIARARFVSRSWMTNIDAALKNPVHHMHPCLHNPCLMLLHPASKTIGDCACLSVYDVYQNTWLPKPILFPSHASFLVGASCGLFCFATGNPFIESNVEFFVGNPLMHAWTCLPHRPVIENENFSCCHAMVSVAFVANEASQGSPRGLGYNLLQLVSFKGNMSSTVTFLMYDSRKRKWDIMGNNSTVTFAVEHIVLGDSGLMHFFDTYMHNYCSYNLHTNKVQEKHLVLVEERRLSMRSVESHPFQFVKGHADLIRLGLPSVVKCAKRLFRVYRIQRRGYECAVVGLIPLISHSWPVGISRLDNNARWKSVSEMPPNLLREAVEEGSDGTDFVIGSDRAQNIFFILRGSSKMLAYDVLSSVWKTMPGCPIGHSFYPYKLYAFYEPLLCIEPPDTHDNASGISL